jgi:oxygen-independent coproporphyrinogen III oxidase
MLKSMEKEIIIRARYLNQQKIRSIYFGGGTPSILDDIDIKKILTQIGKNYSIADNAEITLECNPDDLNEKKLISLKKLGINRLSIGIQSFDDTDLKFMNRSHNAAEAENCIHLAKMAGFKNITIDLIYGLPNQTLSKWEKNLSKMFALNIQHFSPYALTVEKKTVLNHLLETKKVSLPNDEKIVEQFNFLQEKAEENDFIHYEISNFGKKGYFSNHNSSYWKNQDYLGIGPSAHSFNGKSRRWNVSSNKKYIEGLTNKTTYFETEILSTEQQYNEYVLTSLRTIWGVDSSIIQNKFGAGIHDHFLKEIEKWISKKYILSEENIITLTQEGKAFADAIASDLFIV